jgi:hypothetical protein
MQCISQLVPHCLCEGVTVIQGCLTQDQGVSQVPLCCLGLQAGGGAGPGPAVLCSEPSRSQSLPTQIAASHELFPGDNSYKSETCDHRWQGLRSTLLLLLLLLLLTFPDSAARVDRWQ